MLEVKTSRPIHYAIVNCTNIFTPKNRELLFNDAETPGTKRFVVVDSVINKLHGEKIASYFKAHNILAKIVPFVAGEKHKTVARYLYLLKQLSRSAINRRNEPIIAIGGGVLTDIVGFVASCYRRGVPYIKVPTTLLGYVDASIAVKTGINFNGAKNRVGTFHAPLRVILDHTFFITQNKRHIRNGVGEILKLAVIKDAALFRLLEQHGKRAIALNFQDKHSKLLLHKAIKDMLVELQGNLFENNLARTVDFGHTFSTVLETQNTSTLLHGEAVTIDILLSSILAYIRNSLSHNNLHRIIRLIRELQLLAPMPPLTAKKLWNGVCERTYHRDGLQRIPLPCRIGKHLFANDITYQEVQTACKLLLKLYNGEQLCSQAPLPHNF